MDCSVIVPTKQHHESLSRTLRALVRQSHPSDRFEIVVVDDAASRETRDHILRVARVSPVAIRYVPVLARHGAAAALNVGWRLAHGDTIAFTKDVGEPHKLWLAGIVEAVRGGADAGWGVTIVPSGTPPTLHERDLQRLQHQGFSALNAFCKRDVLDDLGGFDERFHEEWGFDRDLYLRLIDAGFVLEHVPHSVVIRRANAGSWTRMLREAKESSWEAMLRRDHPRQYRRHQRPEGDILGVAAMGALALGVAGAIAKRRRLTAGAIGLWGSITGVMAARRLRHTDRNLRDIAEAIATAALLPPLTLAWRARGELRALTQS